MCSWTAAIIAASVVASTAAQKQQADAQSEYQSNQEQARAVQMERNQTLANQNYARALAQERLRLQQTSDSSEQEIQQNAVRAAKARATARVAAGEAGVSGVSVDALLADFHRQEGVYTSSIMGNLTAAQLQSRANEEALDAQRRGQISSIQPYISSPVSQPSYLGAALRIGGITLGAMNEDPDPTPYGSGNNSGELTSTGSYDQFRGV